MRVLEWLLIFVPVAGMILRMSGRRGVVPAGAGLAVCRLLKTLGLSGSIPGERMQAISRAAVRGFLDRYLKGEEGVLLDPAAYPEVRL